MSCDVIVFSLATLLEMVCHIIVSNGSFGQTDLAHQQQILNTRCFQSTMHQFIIEISCTPMFLFSHSE